MFSRLFQRTSGHSKPASPAVENADDGRSYDERIESEKEFYSEVENVHDLPEIFHYWSNKFLLPMLEPFGFTNPNDFFAHHIERRCRQRAGASVRLVSIGSGNGDLELYLARKLIERGVSNFHFYCLDLNDSMLARAEQAASESQLERHFAFISEDFNAWRPRAGTFDIVMANQSLHHVLELEHLFESIAIGLRDGGLFLTSDMVGRNGHQRWPEALEVVHRFWEELPDAYRYNQLLKREEPLYINHDCSTEGFEGIRAQDILPLLTESFNFKEFIPFGNIVFPFIDRAFGHNFDGQAAWDRDFIDRVHAKDEAMIRSGALTPTSMLAVMTLDDSQPRLRDPVLTPNFCTRNPDKA